MDNIEKLSSIAIIEKYGGESEYPCLVKILENYKNK